MKKLLYMVFGGLVAMALVFGAAASFAQSGEGTNTPTTGIGTEGANDGTIQIPRHGGWGHPGNGGPEANEEALAEALGVTVEELEAAKTEARTAAINQAVADGVLTQEQADELLANGGGRMGRFGNMETYLAEALGISVEELQTARQTVFAANLADMVAAGEITQEQADMMLARQAVQGYVDVEAIQAAVQSIYADAITQALADGVITQEQADQLLSDQSFNAPGFGFGGGGHHGPGGRHGGFHGFAPGAGAPAPTDSGNDA